MSTAQRLLAVLSIVLGAIMSTGAIIATQNGEPEQRMQRAKQLTEQGNWKQASDIYAKLALDPAVEGELAARALNGQVQCQMQLNRVDQLDETLKAVLAARPNDWQVLQSAAQLLMQTQHQGIVADQKFTRGYSQRNGGVFIQTLEQDRLQSLQWYLVAIEKAKQSGLADDSSKLGQLYLEFADTLILGRTGQQAWQLQAATDLTASPNYLDLDAVGYAPARFAPANDDVPVTYSVPGSWEASVNDGQRYRWALSKVTGSKVTGKPEALAALRRWADFLNSQFSVETLQQDMWFFQRPAGSSDKEQVDGIAAIHTLADDEAIAKLSTGIKRFKLADEFNPIHQYKLLAASESKEYAEPALSVLYQTFLDRRQYPKAAAMMRESIDRFGAGEQGYKLTQLNEIIQPRVSFDAAEAQVAGKPTELSLRFRNANQIEFTAWSVDVEKLFADTKQAYRQLANQQKPNFGGVPDRYPPNLESPGEIFSRPEIDRYVKGQAANWQQALEPRENHWDRRIQAKTPLVKAG
ncbi:MAG: hypothetical protein SFV81_18845, partial [Pirellulaceae bacterium]|nr:hypothetical protein [Pirellulaceae bacterium]